MNPSELTRQDGEMRLQLVYFLAKLGVYYRYETYAMSMVGFANNVIPAGAIHLPVIDTRIHCLVPRRRRP